MGKKYSILLVLLIILVFSCDPNSKNKGEKMELLAEYNIQISEPSALCLGLTNDDLFTAADNGQIYQISTTGEKLARINYSGQDIEGLFFNRTDSTMLVLEERKQEVIRIDLRGNILTQFSLDYSVKEVNKGPEGICMDADNNTIFAVNEKNPELLLKSDIGGNIKEEITLKLAKDYSGLTFDSKNKKLWVLSHESESLTKCEPDGTAITFFDINTPQAEGVAIDPENQRMYVVDELENKLLVFQL